MSDAAETLPRAWPFEEAQKIAVRSEELAKREVLFETGYGPSGLPHIGTFGEVARTSWVRHAYTVLTGKPSRLLAFSDDMDGLRKVPDNVPNRDMLRQYLGLPLTRIPDPFGTHESFGHHNNARLRGFLDGFGFQYEFGSASDYYASGRFDAALRRILQAFDEIIAVILPTLGPERRATYSPILPIHPKTGVVEQVHIDRVDAEAATVFWTDGEGVRQETSVLAGAAKCQWKADWISSTPFACLARCAGCLAPSRRSVLRTSCFSTSAARRSARARATASVWTTGCAMRRLRVWRSSCTTSRTARKNCFLMSSRGQPMSISAI
jgi:lysyl-tRNA synthetase class 1